MWATLEAGTPHFCSACSKTTGSGLAAPASSDVIKKLKCESRPHARKISPRRLSKLDTTPSFSPRAEQPSRAFCESGNTWRHGTIDRGDGNNMQLVYKVFHTASLPMLRSLFLIVESSGAIQHNLLYKNDIQKTANLAPCLQPPEKKHFQLLA